jgi:exopolyphosphatase/guanosine-5'-triphosphate,3'-diphosphate pyrophosphatase
MPQDLLASLDLGSNTFRLLTARLSGGSMAPGSRRVWQELPRVSQGLAAGGRLLEAPKRRALEAAAGFRAVLDELRPRAVLAGGTMAFREAQDGPAFLAEAGRLLGARTVLLSGEEEARLSALGILSGLDPVPDEGLLLDIGGRSTELVAARGRRIASVWSLPVGVVGLTEAHVRSDPPAPDELRSISLEVAGALQKAAIPPAGPSAVLVGAAGTVTTIAAMLLGMRVYDPAEINNRSFDLDRIEGLLAEAANKTSAERARLPGLHPLRADVICAGLAEVAAIMRFFGFGRLVVSDNSLLEGLWLAAAGLVDLTPDKFTEVAP